MKRVFPIITTVVFLLFYCYNSLIEAEWSEPVNLGPIVNSVTFDYYPCISYDKTKLYFSSTRSGGYGEDDIWVSEWDGEEWGIPTNLGSNINTSQRELSPSISSDGSKLYFISYGRAGGYGSYDVWVSTWGDSTWEPVENVGPNVNTQGIEWSVCISADGAELYFVNQKWPGSYGFFDIWVSHWDGHGWGPAANLGPNINTGQDDEDPSISADGNSLYFASWDTDFIEQRVDVFVSHRDSTGQWGVKERLTINSVADTNDPLGHGGWDHGPSISSDGRRLFFSSRRRENIGFPSDDIWVSEWTETSSVIEEDYPHIPSGISLGQSYPNPFNPTTTIRYSVVANKDPLHVSLKIYDILGREVSTLIDKYQETGYYKVTWNGIDSRGKNVPSGVYFYRLVVKDFEQIKRTVLIR